MQALVSPVRLVMILVSKETIYDRMDIPSLLQDGWVSPSIFTASRLQQGEVCCVIF